MKINSHNEWDKLKEIIVGSAEGRAALIFPNGRPISEGLMEKAGALASKAYPK